MPETQNKRGISTKYSPNSTFISNAFGSPALKEVAEKVLKVTVEILISYLYLVLPDGENSQLGSVH